MKQCSSKGVIGAVLIGVGCGFAAAGLALVIPACADWSLGWIDEAFRRGREGMQGAAATIGDVADRAQERFQHHFGEAAKGARNVTAVAAGAVESAARHVRERTT